MLLSFMIPKSVMVSATPLNSSVDIDERELPEIVEASFHSDPPVITHPIGNGFSTAVGP